jgi:hypothetical protein
MDIPTFPVPTPRSMACLVHVVALLAVAAFAHADVVDRVVAVVGGQAITLSDVRAARALGLVQGAPAATIETLVDRLVVRELMRAEVDRFSIAPGDAWDIDARAQAARQRARNDDGGPGSLDALGMTEPRLRAWIEDDERIERYLQQRFDVAAQPTEEEVLIFFQSREREFVKDGQPQPFALVRDEARARLVFQRRQQMIDEWVAGLRRRTVVVLLPASP